MEALEKAKLALRKHLIENKDIVRKDLDRMRELSEGVDIFTYVDKLSDAFSFETVTTIKEVKYEYTFHEVDCYEIFNKLLISDLYSPPEEPKHHKSKKDLEISSRSFFLILLPYVNNRESILFLR
jgi:hypothetical protein